MNAGMRNGNLGFVVGIVVATGLCRIGFSQTISTQPNQPLPLIVAHRGASHDAPENTLAAFRLAWKQQADGIEGDFHLTKDNQIVCIHDKSTERTAGVDLSVAQSSLAELQRLDVGAWKDKKFAGERIPTLQEVIDTVPPGRRLIIELKVGPEIIAPLKKILAEATLEPDRILVISFHEATIAESKRVLPDIKAHWLTGFDPDDDIGPWKPTAKSVVETLQRINADGLGCHGRRAVFDKKFIRTLKQSGFDEFHVWTIDDPDIAMFYRSQGAFGITTNRPNLIRNSLSEKIP